MSIEVRELVEGVFIVRVDDMHFRRLRDERGSNESDAQTVARLLGRSPL